MFNSSTKNTPIGKTIEHETIDSNKDKKILTDSSKATLNLDFNHKFREEIKTKIEGLQNRLLDIGMSSSTHTHYDAINSKESNFIGSK